MKMYVWSWQESDSVGTHFAEDLEQILKDVLGTWDDESLIQHNINSESFNIIFYGEDYTVNNDKEFVLEFLHAIAEMYRRQEQFDILAVNLNLLENNIIAFDRKDNEIYLNQIEKSFYKKESA